MEQSLEDTQGLSLEELEEQGNEDNEVSIGASNLAPPVNAADAARLLEEDAGEP